MSTGKRPHGFYSYEGTFQMWNLILDEAITGFSASV